ncbi:sulfotransferase family 2 domain-containing protein [Nocardioides kribbensis]|uniref:sulfotransferase family 2 domain-containing protein n=1 Tax=Nocardioides kribbensis TaxID=305517 RepID=UPI0032DB3DEF
MVISDSARLLFVHVQKTGGSTIQRALEPALPDARQVKGIDRHAMLGGILRAEPDLTPYWTVGFVRNPWARMLSWFRMVERFRDTERDGTQVIERRTSSCRASPRAAPTSRPSS